MLRALATPGPTQGLVPFEHGILTGADAQAAHASMRRAMATAATIQAQIMGGPLQGQTMQLALHPGDVHIAEEMSTYLAGFSPFPYMADVAAPLVENVPQLTDQFRKFTVNNAFQRANVLASTQNPVNEVDPETELQPYLCVDRALGGFVPAVTEAVQAKAFDARMGLSRRINWALGLDREIRVFDATEGALRHAAFAAANQLTIGGGNEWDTANGDPIANLDAITQASAAPVTDVFMNTETMDAMLSNANFQSFAASMVGDRGIDNLVTDGQLTGARQFRIPGKQYTIHEVAAKVLNESTGNLDRVLDDRVICVHRLPSGVPVTGEDIVTAQTFRFTGLDASGIITREFDDPRRGIGGGRMMVQGHSEDIVIVANNVGGSIQNTLA